MGKSTKQGSHKNYGNKMANPRIAQSKEHRNRGPLGYYHKARERGLVFITRAFYLENQ